MNKFKLSFTLLLLSLVLVLAACGNDESASGKDGNKGSDTTSGGKDEVVIAVNENFISMDPHDSGDTNSNSVQAAMLEGLFGVDKEGQIINVLAEDYEISDDALTYTFQIKEEVTFHDGEALTAEVVKQNYDRIINDDSLRLSSRGFNLFEEVNVLGDYELEVVLSEPYAAMLTRLASAKLLSPKVLELDKAEIGKNPVGTGPYAFIEWVQGDHLTIENFEDHWSGSDRVKTITYKPIPENGSRVAMLKTGEADFVYPLPVQNVDEIESSDIAEVVEVPSTIANYVSLNTTKGPLQDQKVRQAMNHAIDKEAYLQVVKGGYGKALDSIIPSATVYYEDQGVYEFDVDKAKSILDETEYAGGFDLEIWGNTNSDTMKGMQFIQQQLAQIDINVEIKSMEEGTLSDEIYGPQTPEDAKVQMWYVSWSAFPSDITNATVPLFKSESFPPNGANTAYFKDDDVDRWLTEANLTADEDEQAKLYKDIQETAYAEAPWLFLGVDDIIVGQNKNVSGIHITPDGTILVQDAAVK